MQSDERRLDALRYHTQERVVGSTQNRSESSGSNQKSLANRSEKFDQLNRHHILVDHARSNQAKSKVDQSIFRHGLQIVSSKSFFFSYFIVRYIYIYLTLYS